MAEKNRAEAFEAASLVRREDLEYEAREKQFERAEEADFRLWVQVNKDELAEERKEYLRECRSDGEKALSFLKWAWEKWEEA